MRIVAVASLWFGSNAAGYVSAFRRLGCSVTVVPSEEFVPTGWEHRGLKALRRLAEPWMVRELTRAVAEAVRKVEAEALFVFKGRFLAPEAVRAARAAGAVAVNLYPDVSVLAHGPYIPKALPEYDWVFTTKSFGVADMRERLGVASSSVLFHGYDPDVHKPWPLDARDRARYDCDASFIGTWSPKKERALAALRRALPKASLRIWGAQWERATADSGLTGAIQGRGVRGAEYAKAILASRVNLGLLSEARVGASRGDQITSRTFHIPASGGFLLHERTPELLDCFVEGRECAAFASDDELVERVGHALDHDPERREIAAAGRRRCQTSGYSLDGRVEAVLAKIRELRGES